MLVRSPQPAALVHFSLASPLGTQQVPCSLPILPGRREKLRQPLPAQAQAEQPVWLSRIHPGPSCTVRQNLPELGADGIYPAVWGGGEAMTKVKTDFDENCRGWAKAAILMMLSHG